MRTIGRHVIETRPAHRGPRRLAWMAATAILSLAACQTQEVPPEPAARAPDGVVVLSDAQVEASQITTTTVSLGPVRTSVRVPGTVDSPDTARASVGSVVEGRVVRVLVLPGDRVTAGQPLVEIHSHEVSDAQRNLTAAEARLSYQDNAVTRGRRLYESGAISLEELQRREADHREARADVLQAREMMEHLHATPTGESAAEAPRAGTVFQVHVSTGEAVLPGAPLVELGSTDVLWVTAFVPENTAASLSPGDEVPVSFRSRPGEVARARLVRMSDWVDPANRSVEARFELERIPAGIRPGSFATVDVSTQADVSGAELPEEAVVRFGDGDAVFVVDGPGRYRRVAVGAEPIREGRVAVTGLEEGVEVVVQGAYFLKAASELVPEEGGEA
ncbi:MAG: efflux RND transporter periplasmic adaptor subunit [Gemmatimonadota bacterium]